MIPKPGGGERPLGIPTVRCRVIQTAATLVLEPIFEVDFEDSAMAIDRAAARSMRSRKRTG
jgi:RNA-directed DNA polymerase